MRSAVWGIVAEYGLRIVGALLHIVRMFGFFGGFMKVVAVIGMGALLSLLATVYPAFRAAKVNPVEAIHYG